MFYTLGGPLLIDTIPRACGVVHIIRSNSDLIHLLFEDHAKDNPLLIV